MVSGDEVNGALIAVALRCGMMKHFVVSAAVLWASQLSADAASLLPSQEDQDLHHRQDLPGSRGPILAEGSNR